MNEFLWPIGRAARPERSARAGKTVIQSITYTVRYWRRYKEAQHAFDAVPQHLLGDLGICREKIPAIAAYAAATQVDIATAIDHFAERTTAPLPVLHVR